MNATIVDFSSANVFLQSIEIQVDFNEIIGAVLVFLLIIKPTSIFIEMVLPINSTSKNHENSKMNHFKINKSLKYIRL
jgi:large-conductance mechanosensitive channel